MKPQGGDWSVVRTGPRLTWRFALAAVLVGLAWYVLVVRWIAEYMAGILPGRPWSDFRASDSLEHLQLAISFTLGVLVPAWFFRRFVASIRLSVAVPAAVLGLLLGALCFAAAFFTSVYLAGDYVEEVRDTHGLLGKLTMAAVCVLYEAGRGVAAAAETAYVSLPLSWLSIVLLRWAGGGPERGAAPTSAALETSAGLEA